MKTRYILLVWIAVFVLFYTDTFTFKVNNPKTKESILSLSHQGIQTGYQTSKSFVEQTFNKIKKGNN